MSDLSTQLPQRLTRPEETGLDAGLLIPLLRLLVDGDPVTVEQLAGDLLPNPTQEQLVATGFHRNTMLNEEGGIDPLEFRYLAMIDRVATTGSVWMGLTTGCAQCHTHKFDPITHTDFYALFALLNNADEPVTIGALTAEIAALAAGRIRARRSLGLPARTPTGYDLALG